MATRPVADTYLSVPELMRLARGSYKRAVDIQLAAADLDDLPTTSGYLLAYVTSGTGLVDERIDELGINRGEFAQLVDTLVLRGYLTRHVDPAEGTVSLALTERGHAANEAVIAGCNYVDQELERRLSHAEMAGLRRGLAVLGEVKRSLHGPVVRRGLPPADD